MRIIRFIADDGRLLHGQNLGDGLASPLEDRSIFDQPKPTGQRVGIAKLLAPIIPPAIICIGRNYGEAARAMRQGDHTLEVFLKPVTALQNPNDPICVPTFDAASSQLDCEGELAVIIMREARHVPEQRALDHVLGYTIANDVTARAFQTPAGPPLWMRGKGFDTFCPLGPAIVTLNEVHDPQNLTLRTVIDGVTTREGSTMEMIWSVAEIIACLSRHMTLLPGTVVLTGAPVALHAQAIAPKPNSSVTIDITNVGCLRNTVQ
jgi:2-keto-4-pentenoate hydratase/2-oxohepta-3-ene-1,7-dioic acid hydratase in catechol pathway